MVALKRVFVFVVLGILATNTDGAFAQESDELQESDFKITTSVGLSIKGFFMSTQYSLVDELGFEYDVMSLLRNPTVTEMTGVDERQYEELNDTWWLETKQMRGQVVSGLVSDENEEELKQMFMDAQTIVLDLLEPEQLELLEQAKHHLAIEQNGLANYLASNRISSELALSAEQLDGLAEGETAFRSTFKNMVRDLLVESNEALVSELTQTQQQLLGDVLDDRGIKAFLETELFTKEKSLKGNSPRNQVVLLGVTRSRSVRTECKIDDVQYDLIKDLKRISRKISDNEIADELSNILQPNQIMCLEKIAIRDQCSRLGTVNTLSFGLLSRKLDLTEAQSNELFGAGEEIQIEFGNSVRQAKAKTFGDSMVTLSAEQRDRVIEMIGDADPLKSGN